MQRYSIGLDISTQSLTAVAIDIDSGRTVLNEKLDYLKHPLEGYNFGITEDYIIPPRVPGEADQPLEMFLASLDVMFDQIPIEIRKNTVTINTSGQQHGAGYFNKIAREKIKGLNGRKFNENEDLSTILKGCLSYGTIPIWMTSNTLRESNILRKSVGGKLEMIKITGSDSPLRFTGAVIGKIARTYPEVYNDIEMIHMISNFIPAILSGNLDIPADFGNGSGMSLMDYSAKTWNDELVQAVTKNSSSDSLKSKLPSTLEDPSKVIGKISDYFVQNYDFNPNCQIVLGSGDNPQTKVLVEGDLLSLGTSFVIMTSKDNSFRDYNGNANSMYDGVGRPFVFGCRTNGAMVWDEVRKRHGLEKEDYAPAEKALRERTPGNQAFTIFNMDNESLPICGKFELKRIGYDEDFLLGRDYGGVVDSSLASLYLNSRTFLDESSELLYVTGGPSESLEVMKRVAAIWKRPVVSIKSGAALGAAVAGAYSFLKSRDDNVSVDNVVEKSRISGNVLNPDPSDIEAFHSEGGYIESFRKIENSLMQEYQL